MNRSFQRGNARRFYRIDMPVKVFMTPKSPIKDLEIYATGADYFPPSIEKKIIHKKEKTLIWLDKVQEHKIIINASFKEIIEFIEFFGYCTKLIAQGLSPKKDISYWLKLSHHKKGFKEIMPLHELDPKTYQYFKMLEEKYLTFLNHLVQCLKASSPTFFKVDTILPYGFKFDEIIEKFSSPKFAKIPLIQAIKSLSKFLETYMAVYRQIVEDNYLKHFPKEWKLDLVNISASGISQVFEKRFKLHDKVDVYLYFDDSDTQLHFEAKVVNIRAIEDSYQERISLNFVFPNGNEQSVLQAEIEKFEIKECMDIVI